MKRYVSNVVILATFLLVSVLLNGCGGSGHKSEPTQVPTDIPTPTPTPTHTQTATKTPTPKKIEVDIYLHDDIESGKILDTTVTFNGTSKSIKQGSVGTAYFFDVEVNRVYAVELDSRYYEKQTRSVYIKESSSYESLHYYMTSKYSRLKGTVKDGSKNGLKGATVIIPEMGLTATTDYYGQYRFIDIAPNTSFSIKVLYNSTERTLATNMLLNKGVIETRDLIFE